jgi:4-diphosphocytidyl-2-C-methyl-D-erythritol kinase
VPFFLAGGPALVEGRGERISPLPWLRDADPAHDRPGLLLVTPSCGISTPAAFRAWDQGARAAGGAARMASMHLAEELRNGRLRVADLLARASVLAAANDLAPAAMVVEPGLVPFRRALLRLLARPVGISGSGPTHWAFYPSHAEAAVAADAVRAAVAAGDLPAPGPHEPFVTATRILSTTHAGSTSADQHRREP